MAHSDLLHDNPQSTRHMATKAERFCQVKLLASKPSAESTRLPGPASLGRPAIVKTNKHECRHEDRDF